MLTLPTAALRGLFLTALKTAHDHYFPDQPGEMTLRTNDVRRRLIEVDRHLADLVGGKGTKLTKAQIQARLRLVMSEIDLSLLRLGDVAEYRKVQGNLP